MDGASNGLPRSGPAQLSPAPPPVRASLGPGGCCAPGRERTHCQHGMPSISKPRPAAHSRQLLILFTLLPPSFYFHAESTLHSDSPRLCRESQGNRPVFLSHSLMSSCICVLRRLFIQQTLVRRPLTQTLSGTAEASHTVTRRTRELRGAAEVTHRLPAVKLCPAHTVLHC